MEKGITEAEYQNNTNSFFENKKGTLLRTYKNVSGEKVKRRSQIMIIKKMQKVRFGDMIQGNRFYVQDINTKIEIGGVKASDIGLYRSNNTGIDPSTSHGSFFQPTENGTTSSSPPYRNKN